MRIIIWKHLQNNEVTITIINCHILMYHTKTIIKTQITVCNKNLTSCVHIPEQECCTLYMQLSLCSEWLAIICTFHHY